MTRTNTQVKGGDKYQGWATPQWVMAAIEDRFGLKIGLDTCATADSAKAEVYFTEEDDAFKQTWSDHVCHDEYAYCNPPYNNIQPWIDKALEEAESGLTTIMMLPNRTAVGWFKFLCEHEDIEITLITSRIAFEDTRDADRKKRPNGGNLIAIVGGFSRNRITAWTDINDFKPMADNYA